MIDKSFLKKNFTKDELIEKLIKLTQENAALVYIVEDTLWMAVRYADGRRSYVPYMVNGAIDIALDLKLNVRPDVTLKDKRGYATDGDLGYWNPETNRFTKEDYNV